MDKVKKRILRELDDVGVFYVEDMARGSRQEYLCRRHCEFLKIDSFRANLQSIMLIRCSLRAFEIIIMESLILAQNERWRCVLSMQVER